MKLKIAGCLGVILMSGCGSGLSTGGMAPNFTLENTTGQKVSLNDYRGKVVMLCYWALG